MIEINKLDRTKAPDFKIPKRFDFKKVESFSLSNGLVVNYLNAGVQPVIKLELSFVGGTSQDRGSFASFFTAKMLDKGTAKHSEEQIADFVAFRGASIEIISGNEKVILNVYSLVKHLEEICELLSEMINESQILADPLTRVCDIEYQNLILKESKTSHLASQKFVEELFPNHYYGKKLTSLHAKNQSQTEISQYYTQFFKYVKFGITLAGKIGNHELKLVEQYFGQQTRVVAPGLQPVQQGHLAGEYQINKPDSLQASLRYGFQTIGKEHLDYPAFSIANEIFGGYFGSRLMSNIREEKGYTYGIGSYIVQLRNASYFQISTDIKAENAQDTLAEIKKEINLMCQELITEQELEKVRNYIFGSFANSLNSPFDLLDKFKAVDFIGLDYNFYHRYFEVLKEINPSQIRDIAQNYLTQKPVVVICGQS
jgi:zinc protease